MSRRQFLKKAGAVGVIGIGVSVAGYGLTRRNSKEDPPDPPTPGTSTPLPTTKTSDADSENTPTPETVRYEDAFETVIDMSSVGADPAGNEHISELISEYAANNTLLSFPSGTYQIRPMVLSGLSNFGFASANENQITLVPGSGECHPRDPFLRFTKVDDFLLDGVNFDFRRRNSGATVQVYADGDATIRNVSLSGDCGPNQIAMFRIDIRDEAATGLVERLTAKNVENSPTLTGVYVGEPHAGELTFRNCDLSRFGDNGLYASAPGLEDGGQDGPVNVIGGRYTNNNISNIRLGSTGSTVRDVTVVVDDIPPFDDGINARGIRLRENRDQVIEDSVIRIGTNAGSSFGAIVFHPENGGALVRNTTIQVDKDTVPAVHAFPANPKFDDVDTHPEFDNVTITGSAAEGYAATIIGRDDTVFRNCRIVQSGQIRGGIRFSHSEGCKIIDCEIETTYTPLSFHDSKARIMDTTIKGPDSETHISDTTVSNEDVPPT